MEYRKLGNTGLEVSAISLGLEHLQNAAVSALEPTVARALDVGVNYLDLMLWTVAAKDALGRALRGRRQAVLLAGHLGVANTDDQYRRTRDPDESERTFHDQLARIGTDYVDVLYLTNVDEVTDYEAIVAPGGVLDLAQRLRRLGKARFLALSGHTFGIARRAIEEGAVEGVMQCLGIGNSGDPDLDDFCQLCASRGIGLVSMKSFGGGARFQDADPISPTKCISYTLSRPGVATALLGVKSVAELDANLRYFEATASEKDFSDALGRFGEQRRGQCVYCYHCQPCPSGLDVPGVMRLLAAAQRGATPGLRRDYAALPVRASECTECGICEQRCPFDVEVTAKMREAAATLEG
jgi:hypothetical protein